MSEFRDLLIELACGLLLALPTGILAFLMWRSLRHQELLPPQRERLVLWGGLEVSLLFFTFHLIPVFVLMLLARGGFYTWLYGPDFPLPDTQGKMPTDQHSVTRLRLWAIVIALPIVLCVWLWLLAAIRGSRQYQLGLTLSHWRANAVAGYLCWFVLAPIVWILHALIVVGFLGLFPEPPLQHDYATFLKSNSNVVEWLMVGLSAIVVAPVLEEVLFRGVVQGWLTRRSWGGEAAMCLALVIAFAARGDKVGQAMQLGRGNILEQVNALAPALFVLALVPGYLMSERLAARWLTRPEAARGIFGTAILWAILHTDSWPAPVPLFLFGLGLGYLAYRTQSLVGTITAHALFNAVACLALLASHVFTSGGPPNGSDTTAALRTGDPGVATSTAEPGSWLPRRR